MAAASVLFSAAYAPAHRIGAVPALRRPLAARVPPALLDGSAEDGAAFSAAAQLGREPGTCDPYDPKSAEYCSPPEPAPSSLKRTIRLGVLFFLWYSLNTAYNIGNKLVLTAFPMPWTAATWELFFGFPYVFLLWSTGLRKTPKISLESIKLLAPSGILLAGTHVGGVISFGLGAISFTHVLKATEPVWSALISALFFRDFLPLPVYASLVPIIAGVSLASLKELTFSWMSFIAGTGSAVTSAAKAILSKKVLDGKSLGENLTPANMFAVLSILGFCAILPVSLALEGPAKASAAWSAALAAGYTTPYLLKLLACSGFLYYIYNEVAFLALAEVAPVTHAVTNTVKRVVIILASILVFKTTITPLGAAGSAITVAGALLYALAKNKYK
ncbi:hypothetical protein EMIHUDRAFT_451082 [Emiliania huxleyi CCMP1516]|uniref:Sugar phosphate transporter domain-containing protein n=2 Tax=Emiliania huxleyi TaxID=2903 RepID=A0A0D3J999_EMIH1|nr:hypothetical protein EMIHUDRAFT_451082 [Emiliania huxleyi CCMP1516]EOD20084.1 hypothetical protein EMIHUDRAFT_451082 [Emiliania huxleyi CCMP1516]|eukprot:XP_005772513.1 hypothetical protein EMIHUDRAFT_451082 [Emiliania huxleyi CCMP1516]